MAQVDTENTINVHRARNAWAAVVDVGRRSALAQASCADFFSSAEHQDRVSQVQRIVSSFFTVHKGMYVNHRAGRGRPFTVVKVDNPDFPRLASKRIDEQYRTPLRELGVEVVFSKQTNSYLYRVF